MKSKEVIEHKINSLQEDIDELHNEINSEKERYGGIDKDLYSDILSDITFKNHEINTLKWVLIKNSINQ